MPRVQGNRLIQINKGDLLGAGSFEGDGSGRLKENISPGVTVAKFTYDGLGRLIRTERWRSGGATQVEEYYYDGVRRIQEVETTVGGTSPGTVTREYVWGPGYADEIVCQLDYSGDPLGGTGVTPETYYYLQDANYNVVAVVAPAAAGGYPAQVLYQYTYGPYGDVLAADAHPTLPLPVNRIGHQGLFFERLTTGSVDAPTLAVGARGLYHSRNRWLHTDLGRFLTRDPAEAAIPILTALAFNGDTLDGLAAGTPTLPFSPTGHYADGMNLYQFVGSNPVNRSDPLGLGSWDDPFDDVDEIIWRMAAERSTALEEGMAYWKSWAITAAKGALLAGVMATGPLGLLASGAYMMIEAGFDMYEKGEVTWKNGAEMAAGLTIVGSMALQEGLAFFEAERAALQAYKAGDMAAFAASAARPTRTVLSARALESASRGKFHNFPHSFDLHVVQNGTMTGSSGGYVQFNLRGMHNEWSGAYEIGGQLKCGGDVLLVTHRFFRPDR
ncbi:MAG: hypothetical protein AB1601_03990 [Planctomycetota bacterium]